jgi:hypothetical protein
VRALAVGYQQASHFLQLQPVWTSAPYAEGAAGTRTGDA